MTTYRDLRDGSPIPTSGCKTLLVEVDDDGNVLRELGLDAGGIVIHRMPSHAHRYGDHGFWDVQRMPPDLGAPMAPADFEAAWLAPDVEPPPNMRPRSDLLELLEVARGWLFGGRRRPGA